MNFTLSVTWCCVDHWNNCCIRQNRDKECVPPCLLIYETTVVLSDIIRTHSPVIRGVKCFRVNITALIFSAFMWRQDSVGDHKLDMVWSARWPPPPILFYLHLSILWKMDFLDVKWLPELDSVGSPTMPVLGKTFDLTLLLYSGSLYVLSWSILGSTREDVNEVCLVEPCLMHGSVVPEKKDKLLL